VLSVCSVLRVPLEDSLDVPDDVGDAIAGMVSLLAGFTPEALFA
jgi:hypothetical protein